MKGTCEICGCTQEHACAIEHGCSWANPEETLCSACVGWAQLKPGGQFDGIFAYGLVPVQDMLPRRGFCVPMGRKDWFLRIDVRRLDAETLDRLAYQVAFDNNATAEDFLDQVATGREAFVLRAQNVEGTIAARDLERAVALVPVIRAGTVPTLEMCFGAATETEGVAQSS